MRAAVTSTGKKNKCRAKVNSVFPNVTAHTIISAFPAVAPHFQRTTGLLKLEQPLDITRGSAQGADCPGPGSGYLQGWRVHNILGQSVLEQP